MGDIRLNRLITQPVNQVLLDRAIRHAVFLERYKTTEVNQMLAFLNRDVFPERSSERLTTTSGAGDFRARFRETHAFLNRDARRARGEQLVRNLSPCLFRPKRGSSAMKNLRLGRESPVTMRYLNFTPQLSSEKR